MLSSGAHLIRFNANDSVRFTWQLAINWRFAGKRDLADELGAHMSSMMSEQQEEVVAAEGEGSAPRRFRVCQLRMFACVCVLL